MQKSNHLHNVEHVVRSTFRIMLITFKHKPYNSNFEFTRKRIQIWIFFGGVGEGGSDWVGGDRRSDRKKSK